MARTWTSLVGLATALVAARPTSARADEPGASAIAAWTSQLDADPAALVRALRPRRAELDAATRCVLGLAYGARDLSRASIYAAACEAPGLRDDPEVEARLRPLRARWKASPLSRVVIVTDPDGQAVRLDRFPDEHVRAPATLWLPAATYRVTAPRLGGAAMVEREVVVARFSSTTVLLELGAAPAPLAPGASPPRTLDFEGVETGAAHAGAPPKVVHESLLPTRFRRRPNLDGDLGASATAPSAWVLAVGAGLVAAHAGAAWQPGWMIGACARRARARWSPLLCVDGADRGAPTASAALGLSAGAELVAARLDATTVVLGAGLRGQWRPAGDDAPMSSAFTAAAFVEAGAGWGRWRVVTRLEPGLVRAAAGRELALVGAVAAQLW